jgi:hypothetical protein
MNSPSTYKMHWRRLAVAVATFATFASPAAFAQPSGKLILVPPQELPELARQSGEAMLLQTRSDGTTLLYVEQNQGAGMAVFDVTDPSRVRSEGMVPVDAHGAFDFVFPLGHDGELVRFRNSQSEAVMDLHKVRLPSLKMVEGLNLQGPITGLGADGFIVTNQDKTSSPPARDYQVVDTAAWQNIDHVFDVKQVREQLTDTSTGTTFLLTDNGLYLIRRPAVEAEKMTRDLESAG